MGFRYEDWVLLLENKPTIRELHLQEGQIPFVGLLVPLDVPIVQVGIVFENAIEMIPFPEYGELSKDDCMDVIQGFERLTGKRLIPTTEMPMVHYQGSDFRLQTVGSPATDRLLLTYRKFAIIKGRIHDEMHDPKLNSDQ